MPQQYTGYGMPSIDFSGLGELGNVYTNARRTATRERTLAELGQGAIDPKAAAQKLIAAGDQEGAMSFLRLAESQASRGEASADRTFRQQLLQKQFDLEQQKSTPEYAANLARAKAEVEAQFAPKTTNIKTPSGDEVTVEKGGPGGGYRVPQVEGLSTGDPNNPYALGAKATEAQSKDATYASRMFAAEQLLRDPAVVEAAQSQEQAVKAKGEEKFPVLTAGKLTSENYKKFDQAQRDFINATLRRESGAVINPDEFKNARKQYLPAPGDTPEVLEQKKRNRIESIKGIASGAGTSYKAPMTFDDQGNLVPRGQKSGVAAGPKIGEVKDGYRFKGGDPASPASWVKL